MSACRNHILIKRVCQYNSYFSFCNTCTFLCCRSFLKNKAALAVFLRRSRELGLPPLPASLGSRNNFWSILEGLVKVLTPFEDATLQVSKEEANLSECIPYAQTMASIKYPTKYDQC